MRVLLIEDEAKLAQAIAQSLAAEGCTVVTALDGEEGFFLASTESFDLVVLDLNLPGRDGLAVLHSLRAAGRDWPVLILTARDGIENRVQGLDGGADDYLVKPFAFAELHARVRALTRRPRKEAATQLRCADLELDRMTRRAVRGGRLLELTAREFELLEYLLLHAGHVVSREMLGRDLWHQRSRATPLDAASSTSSAGRSNSTASATSSASGRRPARCTAPWGASRSPCPSACRSGCSRPCSAPTRSPGACSRRSAKWRGAAVLNETFGRLEGSFERLRRFTQDASHELRSVGEAGVQSAQSSDDLREVIGSMLEESDRLARLIEGLLTRARADADHGLGERRRFDLSDLAREVVDCLQVLAEEKRQAIDVDAGQPLEVHADREALRLALMNLVSNAVRYTPAGGRIELDSAPGRGSRFRVVLPRG